MFKNSNNDSFGIHSVKVLVQVHYFWTNLVAYDPLNEVDECATTIKMRKIFLDLKKIKEKTKIP